MATSIFSDNITSNWTVGHNTFRISIFASRISESAQKVQLRFKQGVSTYNITNCYIGQEGATEFNFDGTQQHVTFNGGSSSVSISSGGSVDIVSDEILVDIDETKKVVVAIRTNGTAIAYSSSSQTDINVRWLTDATDTTANTTAPGSGSADGSAYLNGIDKIEIVASPVKAIISQDYSLEGSPRNILDEFYSLANPINAVFEQLYGLRLLTALIQYYGNTPAVRRLLAQYYGSAAVLKRLLSEPYEDALALRQVLDQEWTLPAAIRMIIEQAYCLSSGDLRALLSENYALSEYKLLRALVDQVYVLPAGATGDPATSSGGVITLNDGTVATLTTAGITLPDDVYVPAVDGTITLPSGGVIIVVSENLFIVPGGSVTHQPVVTVTADGVEIDPHHISIEIEESDYAIRGEIHLARQDQFLACQHLLTEITITVGADAYHLLPESPRRSRPEVGQADYIVPCVSKTVLLDAPYADAITREFSGMASAIVTELAGLAGITVSWQIVDWYLPPAIVTANAETPLSIIRKIVAAVGGVLQTTPAGVLLCRPEYPVSVPAWSTAVPDYYLTDMDNFFSVDSTPSVRDGFNRFLISDVGSSAALTGLTIEQVDINAMSKEIRVYQVPWNDATYVVLYTSGGSWVSIVDEGVATETITEQVEIVGGEGQTTKPIYSVSSYDYKEAELGAITPEEDGHLATTSQNNSLIEIVYSTKYYKFIVSDQLIEDVQFFPEELPI